MEVVGRKAHTVNGLGEQAPCIGYTDNDEKFFGRGFPLSDADLFLSATIRVYPRPIF